jgi:hypothetical protein
MGLIRVSAGTTKGYGTKLTFSDSAGIEFGYSSHTITAQPKRASMLEFGAFESANSLKASSDGPNFSLQRIYVPAGISATRIDLLNHYTVAASTNGSMTFRMALYTMSGSTLGTYATMSNTVAHTSAAANATDTAGYSAQSGTQWRSFPLGTWNITPGEYFFGVLGSLNGPAGTTGSMTLYGKSALSIANGAVLAPGSANPINAWGGGIYSTGTASPPATIHISDVNRTGSYALAQPGFRVLGSF